MIGVHPLNESEHTSGGYTPIPGVTPKSGGIPHNGGIPPLWGCAPTMGVNPTIGPYPQNWGIPPIMGVYPPSWGIFPSWGYSPHHGGICTSMVGVHMAVIMRPVVSIFMNSGLRLRFRHLSWSIVNTPRFPQLRQFGECP